MPVTLSQTITNTNTVVRLYAALRTITPTLTVTETLGRIYAALRSLTPTVTITETLGRTLVAIRNLTQTTTITELLVAFKGVAGTGASRILEAATSILQRTGVTTIFKRSGNTSF